MGIMWECGSRTIGDFYAVSKSSMMMMMLSVLQGGPQKHSVLKTFCRFVDFLACHGFYPRDAMLARVIAIATCLSVCLSVRLSRAGIVSKRRKLAAWFLHHLVAPRL